MIKHRLPAALIAALIVLVFLLAASFTANVILVKRVMVEHDRLKSSVVPIDSVDYYRRRLAAVEAEKKLRMSEEELRGVDCDAEGDLDLNHPERSVKFVSQLPEYPNACEAACAVMLLNYHGIDISLSDFINDYLPCGEVYEKNGVRYGPDPAEYYAGDPSDKDGGWGCFAPVIYESVRKAAANAPEPIIYSVYDMSGLRLSVAADQFPTVIWVTTDYTEVKEVFQWQSYDEDQTYSYPRNQHAVIIVDADEHYYYVLDPLKDGNKTAIGKDRLEACYDSMGRQAVTIYGPYTQIASRSLVDGD